MTTTRPDLTVQTRDDRLRDAVRRLAEAAQEIEVLTGGQADAVLDPTGAGLLLLGEAQKALARSESELRLLVERAPVAVLETGADGRIHHANPAATAMLGHSTASLRDAHWRDLPLGAGDVLGEVPTFARLLSREERGLATTVLRPEGTVRHVRWHAVRRPTEGRDPAEIVVFGVDETDRERALEVAVRLAKERDARDRAEAVADARQELLNVLSHDLRTPLGAAMGYASLLEDGVAGPLSPAQRDLLGPLQSSQLTLQRLLDDLMDFARNDRAAMAVKATRGAVAPFLRDLVTLLRPQAAGAEVEIQLADGPDALEVRADFDRLGQALMNVVSNAIRFSPPGGVVRIAWRARAGMLEIDVADQGPGVPEEARRDVFTAFWQREPSDGLGLGLAIAGRIADAHGGHIEVLSSVDGGALFRLRLPVDGPAEPGPAEPGPAEPGPSPSGQRWRPGSDASPAGASDDPTAESTMGK